MYFVEYVLFLAHTRCVNELSTTLIIFPFGHNKKDKKKIFSFAITRLREPLIAVVSFGFTRNCSLNSLHALLFWFHSQLIVREGGRYEASNIFLQFMNIIKYKEIMVGYLWTLFWMTIFIKVLSFKIDKMKRGLLFDPFQITILRKMFKKKYYALPRGSSSFWIVM